MTQDFLRRIDGYNFPFATSAATAPIARNAWVALNGPPGPARVERVWIYMEDTDPITPTTNWIQIVIDGIVIYQQSLARLLGIYDCAYVISPWCSRHSGLNWSQFHFNINLDYETSFIIAMQNTTSPDPCNIHFGINGRRGL